MDFLAWELDNAFSFEGWNRSVYIEMSADKRRLYRLAEPAGGLSPSKATLVQGQPVISQRTLVSSVPVIEDSGSMSLRHAVVPETTPSLRPSTPPLTHLALADETVSPRRHPPRQYLSPTRHMHSPLKQTGVDLTPSDEETLPDLPTSNQDRMRTGGSGHQEGSSQTDYADVSSAHRVLFQETLDAALGSGEVPLSSKAILSPAKVLRHDRDISLSGHPVPGTSSAPSSIRAAVLKTVGEASDSPSVQSSSRSQSAGDADMFSQAPQSSTAASRESCDAEAGGSSQKKPKSKGRYVASRYMQSKPAAPSAATVSRPKPVVASKQALTSKPAGSVAGNHPPARGAQSRQKAPFPVSYKTPHALPANQLLLRARQATSDSLFTPSLQVPGSDSQVTPASRTISSSAVRPGARTASRTHVVKKPPTAAVSHATSSTGRVTRTPAGQARAPSPAATASSSIHQVAGEVEANRASAITATDPDNLAQPQLNCLYVRTLQWAFLDSRAKHSFHVQEREAERWLYAMWQEVESLKRQEANYHKQMAALKHGSLVDSLLYSQLPGLQHTVRLLPALSDTHKALAQALNTVHHQLPVRGFLLPQNLDLLVDAVDEGGQLLKQLVSAASPSQGQLQQLALLLTSLEETVPAEIDEVQQCAELVQQSARVQTALTSIRLHLLHIEQQLTASRSHTEGTEQ